MYIYIYIYIYACIIHIYILKLRCEEHEHLQGRHNKAVHLILHTYSYIRTTQPLRIYRPNPYNMCHNIGT
jgi:hypothetical protein